VGPIFWGWLRLALSKADLVSKSTLFQLPPSFCPGGKIVSINGSVHLSMILFLGGFTRSGLLGNWKSKNRLILSVILLLFSILVRLLDFLEH